MKKQFLMSSFILSAAFVFGGCAKASHIAVTNAQVEKPTETVVPESSQTQQDGSVPNTAQEVSIDYNIDSYASVQEFGYQFFQQNLSEKNPVLSPVSAYLALSMAGCGADGSTKEEFINLLGSDMMALSDDLMNKLPKDAEDTKVSLANSAWLDNKFTVNKEWLGIIRSLMDADAFQAALSTSQTMDSMNNWIKTNTNGLIEKMIEKPLSSDTRLVLFNTLYFKAKWASPFRENQTYEDIFKLNSSDTVQVKMMHKEENMEYLENDYAEGLIFPYKNWGEGDGNLAFVALKPKSEEMSIREVYEKLDREVFSELLSNKQNIRVNTKLPKFEITFDAVLNDSLKNMGLKEAFDKSLANLTQLGTAEPGSNLYISLVRQKAKVIVDEDGTEAAAVTQVAIERCLSLEIPETPKEVYFDEPFVYIIMDMDNEIPLFIGILDNPAV